VADFEWSEGDTRELARAGRTEVLLSSSSYAVGAAVLALLLVGPLRDVGLVLFGMSLAWLASGVIHWLRYPAAVRAQYQDGIPTKGRLDVSEDTVIWTATRTIARKRLTARRSGGTWRLEEGKRLVGILPARWMTPAEEAKLSS
jgi:hypothetical protein